MKISFWSQVPNDLSDELKKKIVEVYSVNNETYKNILSQWIKFNYNFGTGLVKPYIFNIPNGEI